LFAVECVLEEAEESKSFDSQIQNRDPKENTKFIGKHKKLIIEYLNEGYS